MQHVQKTIEYLRRYIATSECRRELEEIDVLLDVALQELKRKLAAKPPDEKS